MMPRALASASGVLVVLSPARVAGHTSHGIAGCLGPNKIDTSTD